MVYNKKTVVKYATVVKGRANEKKLRTFVNKNKIINGYEVYCNI